MIRNMVAVAVAVAVGGLFAAEDFDIVIYGSTPAAISAAVQAKRMGAKAVIVSPETRIGGLTTGGLGQTDIGNKSAFGGIALEFYRDVANYYRDPKHWTRQARSEYLPDGQCAGSKGEDSMWTFEPSAALAILEGWEKREGLVIHRGRRIERGKVKGEGQGQGGEGKVKREGQGQGGEEKVKVEGQGGEEKVKVEGQGQGGRIVSFVTEDGTEYRGKVFIDATYEGDLMAAAGVKYAVGREANSVYGETLNGVQTKQAIFHQFADGVDPYVVKGDPKSGLLPNVEPFDPKTKDGDGDKRMQAYCFRMCLTDDPDNRIPFAKPEGYDERDYELLFRGIEARTASANKDDPFGDGGLPWINSKMPNRKTDTNNRTAFSTDFIGRNWNWPEASYAEREKILAEHLKYQRGLMWTLANHPRVPKAVRDAVSKWGTCKDEFADGLGDGWQRQLYVREGRRMIGDYVMTEANCLHRRLAPRPIAMAAYTMDSHNVRRCVGADGFVHNEGDVEVDCHKGPYGIDYGAIIPKRGECSNLLVPVAISASHIAFGSIRMEPVFFALGQAAGAAAVLAMNSRSVQDVSYDNLARRLLEDGQVIERTTIDPIVPYVWRKGKSAEMAAEIRKISERGGLKRFFIAGPGFNEVMYGPFKDDLYAAMGRDIGKVRELLAPEGIEIGWWCSPSIRYVSDLPAIEDFHGNRSADNKHCPLAPEFQRDWAAKVQAVVRESKVGMINIEDDFTLGWGRGLDNGACYCERHLALFAKLYGKALPREEIAAAFQNRTPENLAIRVAFAGAVRESLCAIAREVRKAIDEVDPTVRVCVCEPAESADRDGDALAAVARAFAGPCTRPAIRPSGAIYGAQTTPADVPVAVAHTMYTLERQSRDIEMFYEADPYPHNRFFASAAQMISLMSGAMFSGSQNILLYCLQYLDDPLEDPGYVDEFWKYRLRLERVKNFIATRDAKLAGVRALWRSEALALTRGLGDGLCGQLQDEAFLCAKMGLPYTTRADAKGPVILAGGIIESLADAELKKLLAGPAIVDAPAAAAICARGFGELLGTEVKLFEQRPPIIRESIEPAAGLKRPGREVNAFYVFCAGTEGTVNSFAKLTPKQDAEIWSRFYGTDGKEVTPSLTVAKNKLGGSVAVLAVSLLGNRSSGLYNLRKQELFRNLCERLAPGTLPVAAVNAPGIWTLANVSADGKEMLVMVNNLSGDVRERQEFRFSSEWAGAKISRIADDGGEEPLGIASAKWVYPRALAQMQPEFILLSK